MAYRPPAPSLAWFCSATLAWKPTAVDKARPEIRAVFSDIEMPESMDGLKLIHAVRKRWPPAVLILASGRVTPLVTDMPEMTVFLGKPYAERDLLKVLEEID
ncbi:response regulator [Bosea sp. 124]|uniref:response regulator n=1 Tax=Bosea sp. 124 TaxID=2135642 RepID=UPI000D471EAD|nr:response regulator [Bosea sp. 124]PTM39531.1 response regulator receiver domain-containing protein [Bosea sp. 124]